MAFISRVGNLLKRNASNRPLCQPSSSGPFLYQAIRCMSSKLFVGGLSYATDDMSLKEAFSGYGEIIEARVIMDRETGRSRGFGFVSFTSRDEASSAMQDMDGKGKPRVNGSYSTSHEFEVCKQPLYDYKDLHGRRIRVNYAVEKSRGGFPGFQEGTGFRDGASYGGGGYGGGGVTPGGYQGGGNYDVGTGGYGGGYRDGGGPADYINRQGDGYGDSGRGNFSTSNGAGGGNFFSIADDGFTGKVNDDPANHSSGGIPDQHSDNEVLGEGLKGVHEPKDDLASAKI